jgi:DNA repair exonuclease SbcCD ATPase subunit
LRPSRLVLENFGPYRERAEVEFSLLGPVFLVCGKTGSGKTSLFDAMTYALYGTAPGARGALERQLWSQHARPGEAPLVEFEFFLGGSEYRALRNPPYRRPAKRGKAEFVEVESTAAFYRREEAYRELQDGGRRGHRGEDRPLRGRILEDHSPATGRVPAFPRDEVL